MVRNRATNALFSAGAILLAAWALAACGGGGGTTAPSVSPNTSSGARAIVRLGRTGLGGILVDSQGSTLYLFKADADDKSNCFGACAAAWPPLRANGPAFVGRGAKPSLIGTAARSDGKPQVTYNGHPLYLYAGDQKPGDTNGQAITGFGAPWFAVSPSGNQVPGHSSSASSGGSGSSPGY